MGISIDFFSSGYLDVSVPRVRLLHLCIQCKIPVKGGFPHSEISGSKVACHLPEAYRRLLRPSSPLTAKASTVCAYSLDHTVQANKILMRLLFFIVVLSISPDRCVKIHIGLEKIQYSIVIFLKSSDKKSVINTSAYR